LGGRCGEQAPAVEEGFLAYAASLPSQDIYQLVSTAQPAGDILVYKYPASRRRRYETLKRLPAGLVAIGDAVCSFNPIYGQGMTVCALEAQALGRWWQGAIARGQEPETRHFFQMIARLLATPWKLSTDAEKEHLTAPERRTLPAKWLRAYFLRLRQASQHNAVVALAFIRVTQLLSPPASLFHPRVMAGVFFGKRAPGRTMLTPSTQWRAQAT
jgi:2-polyprenyl-6-methoxyphenol hydroxylase-like FAD-dependent oxidoreductase